MDHFLPIVESPLSFDSAAFFSSSFSDAKQQLFHFAKQSLQEKMPDFYTRLFNESHADIPNSISELCNRLKQASRQCHRNLKKHFGINPKHVLSVLHFQKYLAFMLDENQSQSTLEKTAYYDQSHFINDFRKNIGITPSELTHLFKN